MTRLLLALSLCSVIAFLIYSEQTSQHVYAVPVVYNQTTLNIPWTVQSRNATVEDVFMESGNNGTITAWYHHTNLGTQIIKMLGTGITPLTTVCTQTTFDGPIVSNGSTIYYECGNGPARLDSVDTLTGTDTHYWSNTCASPTQWKTFPMQKGITLWCNGGGGVTTKTSSWGGNQSIAAGGAFTIYSNMHIANADGTVRDRYNNNATGVQTTAALGGNAACELTYFLTNFTNTIDSIGCDISIPNHAIKYWNGLQITKVNYYYINSTLPFFNSINASPYKTMLTLTADELSSNTVNINDPFVSFILHANNIDYLFVLTSTNIYYAPTSTVINELNQHRATQTYETVLTDTPTAFNVPTSVLQSFKIYGPSTNQTISKFGMMSMVSGFTLKAASSESAVRPIDPQWTNDNKVYPIIGTSTSLFPIILTVSNAPIDAAIKVTNPYQIINNLEGVWTVTRLDSTHTAEFDIPANQCPNVYVADNSLYPLIYNFEGTVCATGTTQKTIAYTNTLPMAFWTNKYSATHTYLPATNSLTVTTRSSVVPFTYNVIVKNSTGAIAKNYTATINGTLDTHTFNVTNSSKPSTLYVSVLGSQIYAADLGSPISYASIVSFFSTYFSYQGFNLLSMIPIIFASMFTRNTVGIGTIATVLCIATLSWLSVLVLDQLVITILFFISVIGLVAYRVTLY